MLKKALCGALFSVATVSQAYADAPNVAVDIAPLHSLVTQVMEGVGEPALLIRPEASPHEYTLRPSEAKALADADVVFWIGERFTPWLEKPLSSLARSAKQVEMLTVDGNTLYEFREGARFESHHHKPQVHNGDEHDHHHDHEDNHGHEGHQAHANESSHEHHDHDGNDPHLWLDPQNAILWVSVIAQTLSDADPEHAGVYLANAQKSEAELHALTTQLEQQAEELNGIKFIVFHDAYQYFEKRFDLLASGAISISDASDPSPARVAEIRDTVKDLGVTCVFTEPQYNPQLVKTVFENSSISTIGTMDPLGANLKPGKTQYAELLSAMIESLQSCHAKS